ncbi:MAG: TrmH family RNA methyltransferase [bacterium]
MKFVTPDQVRGDSMSMKNIILILENIRSCFNVGAIFRSAEALGISEIWTVGFTPRPGDAALAKTALGAEKLVKHRHFETIEAALESCEALGAPIIALETSPEATPLNDFKPKLPLALIVGNEVTGVSDIALRAATEIVAIPMRGKKESLNVAVAASIALYSLTLNK